jgi:glycerol kinase
MAPGGSVLGRGSAAIHPQPGPGGAVIEDPEELLGSVVTAERQALIDAGRDVGVVGLGNHGETVLACDPDTGRTHGPAISWQDRRAAGLVDRAGPAVQVRVGSARHRAQRCAERPHQKTGEG